MMLQRAGDVARRLAGRGTCPYEASFVLELSLRRLILSPERLADRLHLAESARVLEVGPGGGYFSREIARRLPREHLVAFDLQYGMLLRLRRKRARAGLVPVSLVQGDARYLPFEAERFDVLVLVSVLGEVPEPRRCLAEAFRVVRPGGLLSITEQPGDPDFMALPVVRELATAAGFVFDEQFGAGKNYTANFRR